MKSFIVFALIVAAAVAAPAGPEALAKIIAQASDNIGVDGYKASYETENGIKSFEEAQLLNKGSENEGISVRGQYSYVDPLTGVTYTVNWEADNLGFRAEGAHLPKA